MIGKRTHAIDLLGSTALGRAGRQWRNSRIIRAWRAQGCPFRTPHAYKQQLVCDFGQHYGLQLFVETGTQHGDMLMAVMHAFERMYSIELHPELFAFCRKRFSGRPAVQLIQGDSADAIREVLAQLDAAALFFLDAHYFRYGLSGRGRTETPVLDELAAILADSRHRHILIDDAHCFTPQRHFPSLVELQEFVRTRRDDLLMTVAHDIIRITPRSDPSPVERL